MSEKWVRIVYADNKDLRKIASAIVAVKRLYQENPNVFIEGQESKDRVIINYLNEALERAQQALDRNEDEIINAKP